MPWSAAATLAKCCSLEFCESQLGSAGVRTRLRVGTTTGLRDEPLNAALSLKRYEQMPGASVEWVQLPRDINAVKAMLSAGLLDLAAVHSEDAIAQLFGGSSELRICGMFQSVPRRWCCVVPRTSPQESLKLNACTIAIPGGLASKLMVALLLERLGCADANPATLEHDDLSAALRSLTRSSTNAARFAPSSQVQAVLWEIGLLERSKLKEWCHILDEFPMPWPSHLLISTKETLFAKLCTIRYFMCFTNLLCQDFQVDSTGDSLEYLVATYCELRPNEARTWLRSGAWTCTTDVDVAALEGPLELLKRLELLPPTSCLHPSKRLARGVRLCRLRVASQAAATPAEREIEASGGEEEEEDDDDAPAVGGEAERKSAHEGREADLGSDVPEDEDLDEGPRPTGEGTVSYMSLSNSSFPKLLSRCNTLCSEDTLASIPPHSPRMLAAEAGEEARSKGREKAEPAPAG